MRGLLARMIIRGILDPQSVVQMVVMSDQEPTSFRVPLSTAGAPAIDLQHFKGPFTSGCACGFVV